MAKIYKPNFTNLMILLDLNTPIDNSNPQNFDSLIDTLIENQHINYSYMTICHLHKKIMIKLQGFTPD